MILHLYKRNEELNMHAENLVLLANAFGGKAERRLAKINLQRRNRLGCVDSKLNALANRHVGKYYELLIAS